MDEVEIVTILKTDDGGDTSQQTRTKSTGNPCLRQRTLGNGSDLPELVSLLLRAKGTGQTISFVEQFLAHRMRVLCRAIQLLLIIVLEEPYYLRVISAESVREVGFGKVF